MAAVSLKRGSVVVDTLSLPLFFGVLYAPCFAVQYLVPFLLLQSSRLQAAFHLLLFYII